MNILTRQNLELGLGRLSRGTGGLHKGKREGRRENGRNYIGSHKYLDPTEPRSGIRSIEGKGRLH